MNWGQFGGPHRPLHACAGALVGAGARFLASPGLHRAGWGARSNPSPAGNLNDGRFAQPARKREPAPALQSCRYLKPGPCLYMKHPEAFGRGGGAPKAGHRRLLLALVARGPAPRFAPPPPKGGWWGPGPGRGVRAYRPETKWPCESAKENRHLIKNP